MTQYRCMNCKQRINPSELVEERIQCTYCGYRILEKARPEIVHKIKAR
ncbi:MAG: DNA-directed RNA polymerase subunit P [Methanobacteriota archaeon]|nr:MAG: DNA-directed RNA polymerase subunit P [Euryarchaeota archaeon]